MSDLHQYELHCLGIDKTSGGETTLIRLVWAYSVQEAVFQFDLEWKARTRLDCKITEAGPVKKSLVHFGVEHFHVCLECQEVVACELPVCPYRGRSDSVEPCQKCMGRKPHRHSCIICRVEYDCGWIEKNTYCWPYNMKDVPCTKHSHEEVQAFFQKEIDEGRLKLEAQKKPVR